MPPDRTPSAAYVPLRLCFAFDDPGVVHLTVRQMDSDDEQTLCGRRAMPGELSRRATTCEDCDDD